MKNLIVLFSAVILISSCGPKTHTACDCFDMRADKSASEANKKWCQEKIAGDAAFAKEVTDCGIRALGKDPAQVTQGSDLTVEAGTYNFSTEKSIVKWTGRKAIGSHKGDLKIKSGSFTKDAGGCITTGKIVIDMTSLSVTDIEDEKQNADLKGHLMAADFFDVEKHGEAIFEVTDCKKLDDTNNALDITGNLTIKGISKPANAKLMAVRNKMAGQITLAGGVTFDRTDYGITYPGMADNLIQDNVSLQITLVAN